MPIVESYLDSVNVDIKTRCELATYISLVRKRASGELCTAARWFRDFVRDHPAYKHDSVIDDELQKDLVGLVIAVNEVEEGLAREGGERPPVRGLADLPKLIGDLRCT